MNIYLVRGTVTVSYYMGDTQKVEDMRLVRADSEAEARDKYADYWDRKTSEYSVYYYADGEVMETVE
jgi:hypothetical protein